MKKRTPKAMFTEADGRQLAVDLIRELQSQWLDQPSLPTDAHVDAFLDAQLSRPPTILRRYLAAAHRGGRKLERGFLCVLSDVIASSCEGSPEPEYYEARLSPSSKGLGT